MKEEPANCPRVGDGTIERYLAGAMTEEEQSAFEAHYLTCEHCQRELEFGVAVRDAVNAQPGGQSASRARGRTRWLAAATTMAAAAVVAILIVRPAARPEVERLGAVEQAPIYLGVALRGDDASGDSLFGAAMRAYQGGDYRSAIATLERALAAGFEEPPAHFFLGASLLMRGDAGAAEEHFRAVIDAGETPYLQEARFYRAKALLQRGRVPAARAQLEAIADRLDDTGAQARELLEALESIERG